MTATINLSELELKEILVQLLEKKGISVSLQNIVFEIKEVTLGDQRDSWKEWRLTDVKITGIKVGN